jgi:hypothetical protein
MDQNGLNRRPCARRHFLLFLKSRQKFLLSDHKFSGRGEKKAARFLFILKKKYDTLLGGAIMTKSGSRRRTKRRQGNTWTELLAEAALRGKSTDSVDDVGNMLPY